MTRINTNLGTLKAQIQFDRVQSSLGRTLERLSTGLRINHGSDDPAGLIASESLRRQAVGITAAIDNTQRACNLIATAEGALSEVSALLLDIKELIIETANSGAMSRQEIEANQLQVDEAIKTIDRIANMSTFAGRPLLNGAMSYTLSGVEDTKIPIAAVTIDHALRPEGAALPVTIEILTEGQQGQYSWQMRRAFLDAATSGTSSFKLTSDIGSKTFTFSNGVFTAADIVQVVNNAESVTGVTASLSPGDQIDFSSSNHGPEAFVTVEALQPAAAYWDQSGSFLSTVDGEWILRVSGNEGTEYPSFWGGQTPAAVVSAVNAVTANTGVTAVYRDGEFAFTSEAVGPGACVIVQVQPRIYLSDSDSTDLNEAFGLVGIPAEIDWPTYAGFLAAAATGVSTLEVSGNAGTRTLSFGPGVVTPADIVTAVNNVMANTAVTASFAAGTITFNSVGWGPGAFVRIKGLEQPQVDWGGSDQTDFITAAATVANTLEVTGRLGTKTLTFDSIVFTPTDIVNAVNGVTGDTGVFASLAGGVISFASELYGPNELVSVLAMHPIPSLAEPIDLSENTGVGVNVTDAGGDSAVAIGSIDHNLGTVVDGQYASLDSLKLGVDLTFGDFVGQSVGGKGCDGIYSVFTTFYVTGGGMNFQITPDMSMRGRVSFAIPSVTSSNLGNPIVGFLSEIRSDGGSSLLSGGAADADKIVAAAITQIAKLRGELGALEKDVLEPNMASQRVALENTLAGESVIRDADFAFETMALARARILNQVVSRALAIANARPRSILLLVQ